MAERDDDERERKQSFFDIQRGRRRPRIDGGANRKRQHGGIVGDGGGEGKGASKTSRSLLLLLLLLFLSSSSSSPFVDAFDVRSGDIVRGFAACPLHRLNITFGDAEDVDDDIEDEESLIDDGQDVIVLVVAVIITVVVGSDPPVNDVVSVES